MAPVRPSEEELGRKWDRCLVDTTFKAGTLTQNYRKRSNVGNPQFSYLVHLQLVELYLEGYFRFCFSKVSITSSI